MQHSSDLQLALICILVVLAIVLVIKPLREVLVWFIKDIAIPSFALVMNYVLMFIVKLFKDIIMGHVEIIKNMIYPRDVIFVTLDSTREERDRAMNRKTN